MAGEKIYISEYATAPQAQLGNILMCGSEPSVAQQVVDISGGHAESAAFNAATRFIRLHTNSICSFAFGTAPVATTSYPRMAASATEFFGVVPGQKVSAVINT